MKKYHIYGLPTKDAAWLSLIEDEGQTLWERRYKKHTIKKPKKIFKVTN